MSPLERLGCEVVAFNLLGSRSQAAVLLSLLDANGRPVSWDRIARARRWRMEEEGEIARRAVKTRVCLLRESLDDIGLGNLIQTCPGTGYALPEPGRSEILSRLMEEAA